MLALAGGFPDDAELLYMFDLPAVCMLLDDNGLPHEEACAFLAYTALRSRSVTGDTVRTYGESLVSWLRFLRKKKRALTAATEEELRLYANTLAREKDREFAQLSPKTVGVRVHAAAQFAAWGNRTGVMPSPLGTYLLDRAGRAPSYGVGTSRVQARARSLDPIVPRTVERLPQVLSSEEIHRLFIVAPPRMRLMFRWAITTGMRRFEVCDLTVDRLPSPEYVALKDNGLIPINVLRKGGREKTVQAPSQLVEETLWYVLMERPAPAERVNSKNVFLNRAGRPYSRASITRAFRACADQIGSTATLHHLRHTFAVHVLGALEKLEAKGRPMNSLKALQMLLGHSNVTTVEIYLRAIDATSDEVRSALDFLYGETL